jgi:hypothetical protein
MDLAFAVRMGVNANAREWKQYLKTMSEPAKKKRPVVAKGVPPGAKVADIDTIRRLLRYGR